MANNCYYEMMICGRRQDCREWLRRMRSDDEPNHFWRMYKDLVFYDKSGDDENFSMKIAGECAWSLETCCRASGYSKGIDLFAVNTKELNIVMEAYSQEEGMGFQEHYYYDKGECKIAECVDWEYVTYDPLDYNSFDEFITECELPDDLTEDDLVDGAYSSGGFESWEFSIAPCSTQNKTSEYDSLEDSLFEVDVSKFLSP